MRRITVRVLVTGRVQGVSFRAALRDEALRRGIDGWVRNRDDGSVEALLQGEEEGVRTVVDWARVGPTRAEVSMLTEEPLDAYRRLDGFLIVD